MEKVETRWGYWTVLTEVYHMKVKELVILPGCSISLQYHKNRSEHWKIKSGYGILITGDLVRQEINGYMEEWADNLTVTLLHPDKEVEIKKRQVHKVLSFNYYYPEDTDPLVIIETQVGYPKEDDIVRLEKI